MFLSEKDFLRVFQRQLVSVRTGMRADVSAIRTPLTGIAGH
jgi:hypothetical protein